MNKDLKNNVDKKQPRWLLKRKQFIGAVIAGSAFSQIPFRKSLAKIPPHDQLLNERQIQIIESVQEILFPSDGNGPGASDINAADYFGWILSDPNKDPEEVSYFINGIGWVEESEMETFSKNYLDLEQVEKEKLISDIANTNWEESWLSMILSFIFEALLFDPQYGGNPNNIGWDWLNYYAGQPKPTEKLLYPEILKTIRRT